MQESHLSNTNADRSVDRAADGFRQRTGVVDGVDGTGEVRVRFSDGSHRRCAVQLPNAGDDYVPTVGDVVQVSDRTAEVPIIVGVSIPSGTVKRAVDPGERVLGHPSSPTNVRFTDDGRLLVTVYESDGETVALQWEFDTDGNTYVYPDGTSSAVLRFDENGLHFADNQVMTDISTSSDSDGHVTSVTPVYTQTISL